MAGVESKAASLARAARDQGLIALKEDNLPSAVRWLERAHRLVPADPNVALSLATACLGYDDVRAAALFREVLADNDLREAWLGLASACFRLNDPAEASRALATALGRFTAVSGSESLADTVVAAEGLSGWCGLLGSGVPVIHAAHGISIEVRLDGRRVTGKLPKKAWTQAGKMTVMARDRHLLGSPVDVAAIGRVVGCVEAVDGGIKGWAWHPGDPETSPVLTVRDATGHKVRRLVATDEEVVVAGNNGLLRARGFYVPAARLGKATGPFRVLGHDGNDLLGSPLDPNLLDGSVPQAVQPAVAPRTPVSHETPRPVDVVIPVRDHPDVVLACLESVLASGGGRVVVVDDASRETVLIAALDRLAKAKRIHLVRHDRPLGFPASANAGIETCANRDVVLLNSDTLVAQDWLERLRLAAYCAPDIGTVTPFSNNASILTYPVPGEAGATPDFATTVELDRLARRANPTELIDIPVGVGFCLYIKRTCLDAVGLLRAGIFAQGYGEENDFCLRATRLGWRHVAAPGVFVAHRGGTSFGSAANHLRIRNEPILNRLHPGYPELIQSFLTADPLAEARRSLDLARWRAAQPRRPTSVVLITHADGGGVEQRVAAAAAGYRADGLRPVVLRPALSPDGREAVVVGDGTEDGFPNLSYKLPEEMPALLRLLRATQPGWVELHHLLNHSPAIYDAVRLLRAPYDVHLHDYAWICPRISLMGGGNRYCGEPDLAGCDSCIAQHGRLIREDIGVEALRRRSTAFLARARRVVAPSRDAATRMQRYFTGLRISVVPHTDDARLPPMVRPHTIDGMARVCVAGAIGPHKGYDILLACARDAAERDLKLKFVVVGDTTDDESLFATGRVFITGTYKPHEAVDLMSAQTANLGFIPSVWPETWSLTLTELWQAGLPVAAFDLGAPAERIRATGRGFVLPLGLPAAAINNVLLAAIGRSSHE